MSLVISNFTTELTQRFLSEKRRLESILGSEVRIEHVGSSAVGIGGKNIIDILIGAPSKDEMEKVRDVLAHYGYFIGNDNHEDRLFLASAKEETGEGDMHIHICLVGSDRFLEFLILRDYLLENPDVAVAYFEKKKEIVKQVGENRKEYKRLKSQYVMKLLENAKNEGAFPV